MNQEEFDKRLSESFRNENLPPDTRLWQNISSRLDENSKRPFWVWMVPVVVLVALVGWLVTLPFSNNTEKLANQSTTEQVAENEKTLTLKEASKQPVAESTDASESSGNDIPVSGNHQPAPTFTLNATTRNSNSGNTTANNPNRFQKPVNIFSTNYFQPTVDPAPVESFTTLLTLNPLVSPLIPKYELPKEELIAFESPFKDRKTYKSPYSSNPVNYDSRWWWNIGLGPQVTFNKAIIPSDSEAFVHKDLWANRKKMSANGSGFHSQFLLGHSLGNHFSVESGFQFGIRAEEIKFNITSYSVETRSPDEAITSYKDSIIFWIHLSGSLDSTWYYAIRGFSLAEKNKYKVFTIPVKFNFEYDLSSKTKFVAGIGAGFSAITSRKSTHLNLVHDNREIIDKKTHQFTGSLSAQFGFYTNFNDIGQLGIYSGFQMYTNPWELSNKQYGIKMSDLQLGISFRRPLNW